jgi:signal transduction histidine kinase
LKHKILSFLRGLGLFDKNDVFKQTRTRLTRIYSGLLILFLTVFIVIVYSVLHVTILNNQEKELQTLISQETGFIETNFLKGQQSDLHGIQNQEVIFAGVNQNFYYVVDSSGKVIIGSEADHRLRPELLQLVNGENQATQIQQKTLHIGKFPRGNRGEFHPHEGSYDLRLMIASQPIYQDGQYVGQLYVGKDISFVYQLFHWILIILVILGLIFFCGALYMSVVMSKRAMVPIKGAFTRQREFVADASHELRTPLSVLLSTIDAIEMTVEEEKDTFVGKMLTNMRLEVKRMTHLVSDLLTLARTDSNKIERKKESFDFRLEAEKAIQSVRPLADSKGIMLNLTVPETLPAIGDKEKLSQLLYILLDNAIKYTPNEGEVDLLLEQVENDISIAVKDTGIGIKQEDYQRIFERFYRADKSRSRQLGGHGLGLSIAKWIADMHHGTIKVTSVVGKGSIFFIRIPNTFK